jgi:RNA polymerase sigma-70 factor (family 1)
MSSATENNDEKSLLQEFREGNSDALQHFYKIHYHTLWNYARKLVEDDLLAEDIVMETFLKTWDRRGKFQNVKGIVYYLFAVARNACLDQIRLSKRRQVAHEEIGHHLERTTAEMETELIRAELCQLAFLKAEELPEQRKKVFMMIFREGLELTEISERLGISINTVKTHRVSALKSLRQTLARHSFIHFNLFFF